MRWVGNIVLLALAVLPASGGFLDCNGNGVNDTIDILNGSSADCDDNGVPDECQPFEDCDGNGVADFCDAVGMDCNDNGLPDNCDLHSGTSADCNANSYPDECDVLLYDCDGNGGVDSCDAADGTVPDCNDNGNPDICDIQDLGLPDCNTNQVPDECDLALGLSADCDDNLVPDECDEDCDGNSSPDVCDVADGKVPDCDGNGIPDSCDVAQGAPDCNGNDSPDACDLVAGLSRDCDTNSTPDECQADCDVDGLPDACEQDCDFNLVPDDCQTTDDCDGNGEYDICDIRLRYSVVETGVPSASDVADIDGDGDFDVVTTDAWYPNVDGLGTMGAAMPIFSPTPGTTTWGVRVADLDNDGDGDLIRRSFDPDYSILEWSEQDAGQLFGSLNEVFRLGFEQSEGTEVYYGLRWVEPVDVDNDGDQDIAYCFTLSFDDGIQYQVTLAWYENEPLGQFGTAREIHTFAGAWGSVPVNCRLADVNGDGALDGVMMYWAWGLSENFDWLANDGQGNFGPPTPVTVPLDWISSVWNAADMDGDRDNDLFIMRCNEVHWYENGGGTGLFEPSALLTGIDNECVAQAHDLDRDGDADLVTQQEGNLTWYESLAGVYEPGLPITDEPASVGQRYPLVDVDEDGLLDIPASASGEFVWLINASDDCDNNGIPDSCEADCNRNEISDRCDLRDGRSIDCNGNDVPDECDAGCTACDADGDLCVDLLDASPGDASACGDSDSDGCDDCSSGSFDPENDGPNSDVDGICDTGDCAPLDNQAWFEPGPATGLAASRLGDTIQWDWQPPLAPGGFVRYDTLRSTSADGFDQLGQTACVESGGSDTSIIEAEPPAAGEVLFYLVRVVNGCPGDGAMGPDSDGALRTGIACE